MRNDNYKTVDEALQLWTHKFSKRPHVISAQFLIHILQKQPVDLNDFRDKNKTCMLIAHYIQTSINARKRIIKNNKLAKNICPRTKIKLNLKPDMTLEDFDKYFNDFYSKFKDKTNCQKCNIKDFVSNSAIELKEIKSNSDLKISGVSRDGFTSMTKNMDKLKDEISCRDCISCGDLIISLISSNGFQLEHTDNSFDFLMQILKKSHRKLDSEIKVFEDTSSGS